MTHVLRTTVDDFIHGLTAFERDLISKDAIARYCNAARLSAEALQPYAFFRDDMYTRNLVYRDDLFEVMVICWGPGHKTTIHTHNGQLGWMDVPQGELHVHNYQYLACNAPENQNVVGIDCTGGASEIHLLRKGTMSCHQGGTIYTVDKLHTIHQVENPDTARAAVLSLHVYSRPIDSCIAFDLEGQRCYRRTLSYYSRKGKIEVQPTGPGTREYSLPILK